MFVDSDTHIDECEDTWAYIPKSMEDIRPGTMTFLEGQAPSYLTPHLQNMWFIDGRVQPRRNRSDERTGTTLDKRELRDIPGRLKDMDEYGVATQILYPTIFLAELTLRPEVDRALCESWNRWVADRCIDSRGRLRWVALAPMTSIPDALVEIRRAKEAGAIGIFKRGIECGELQVADPYFDPIYHIAQELDMPICVHSGLPYNHRGQQITYVPYFGLGFASVQNAFFQVLHSNMPARFPTLRIGFIEAGASWLPGLLWAVHARRTAETDMTDKRQFLAKGAQEARRISDRQILRESRVYVTCEASEYIDNLTDEVGDTNLMVGSDYCHSDQAAVLNAHRSVMEQSGLSGPSADRLTRTNGAEFYGLSGF